MPQYAVLIFTNDSAHAPEATQEQLQDCDDHYESMVATGKLHSAYAFTPRDYARTLRAHGATDGPYNANGDVVAGIYILNAASLDEAAALASKDPALISGGGLEIRPVHSGGQVTKQAPTDAKPPTNASTGSE